MLIKYFLAGFSYVFESNSSTQITVGAFSSVQKVNLKWKHLSTHACTGFYSLIFCDILKCLVVLFCVEVTSRVQVCGFFLNYGAKNVLIFTAYLGDMSLSGRNWTLLNRRGRTGMN